MKYAVNIYDWPLDQGINPASLLLRPVITSEIVQCEGRGLPDGDAVLVRDDISIERWDAIKTILRERHGYHKNKARLYESKTGKGGWKRV